MLYSWLLNKGYEVKDFNGDWFGYKYGELIERASCSKSGPREATCRFYPNPKYDTSWKVKLDAESNFLNNGEFIRHHNFTDSSYKIKKAWGRFETIDMIIWTQEEREDGRIHWIDIFGEPEKIWTRKGKQNVSNLYIHSLNDNSFRIYWLSLTLWILNKFNHVGSCLKGNDGDVCNDRYLRSDCMLILHHCMDFREPWLSLNWLL